VVFELVVGPHPVPNSKIDKKTEKTGTQAENARMILWCDKNWLNTHWQGIPFRLIGPKFSDAILILNAVTLR
jgi:hypothetical protein